MGRECNPQMAARVGDFMSSMNRLVIGCGFLGSRVARRWHSNSDHLSVLTRERDRLFHQMGYDPIVGDITDLSTLPHLPAVETVLFAVGFDRSRYKNIHEVYVDGLANVLARIHPETRHFIYVSSTGVYGVDHGERVDEETEASPTRDGGRACLAAEELLHRSKFASRTTILRLAGIYGQDRIPMLHRTRKGISPTSYLNLIHVDDATSAILECASQRPMHETFLVSDGTPAIRGEYYAELQRYSDLDPQNVEWGPSTESRTGKRIDNTKLVERLGFSPKYPSYREGLAQVFSTPSPQ